MTPLAEPPSLAFCTGPPGHGRLEQGVCEMNVASRLQARQTAAEQVVRTSPDADHQQGDADRVDVEASGVDVDSEGRMAPTAMRNMLAPMRMWIASP